MNGGISIHVVDVAAGRVAVGLRVRVERLAADGTREAIVDAAVGTGGTVRELDALHERFPAGVYEATLFVGDFYRAQHAPLPDPPFLDVVPYRFGIADAAQHYHLPFKTTPWGFSCFRGGA